MTKYFLYMDNRGFKLISETDKETIKILKDNGYVELSDKQCVLFFETLDRLLSE